MVEAQNETEQARDGKGILPPLQLRQMVNGYWLAQAVYVAAKLSLADHLTDGPKLSDELARAIDANPGALYRLLRACAGFGLFAEVEPRVFALTPLGELLRSNVPGSLRDYAVATVAPGHWLPWGHLEQAVKSGRPTFKDALGMEVWEYYAQNEEERTHFAKAMDDVSTLVANEVVTLYDVSKFKKIVDVGGSSGVLLAALLRAAPSPKGVLFDLPNLVEEARVAVEHVGLDDRIELVGGDFFKEVPSGGDLYLLKQILHDWDDKQCAMLLKNIHRAAEPQSKLLIVEMVVPDKADSSPVNLGDLDVLVMLGGRERSRSDFESLLSGADYTIEKITPTSSTFNLIEATWTEREEAQ